MNPTPKSTAEAFDDVIKNCRELVVAKSHDYGDSWREMRLTSITDQLLIKVRRIKRLEDLKVKGETPMVSEGIEAEYRDILNYCAFALIMINEERTSKEK